MNERNKTLSRLLAIGAALSAYLICPAAQADDPPAPTVTVLVYYDGTPSLAEAYEQALLGFAENAHYLPVEETDDAIAFEEAVVNGDYAVFVAVTADGALAESWAEQVPPDTNFVAFYPSADPAFEVTVKIVFYRTLDTPSPKEVRHINIAPVSVTFAHRSGEAGANGSGSGTQGLYANASGDGWVERAADRLGDRVSAAFEQVKKWLDEAKIKAQREAAEMLRKIAAAIEALPHPEDVNVAFTVTIGIEHGLPVVKGTVTVETTGENGAALARTCADILDPVKETTPPPTPPPAP